MTGKFITFGLLLIALVVVTAEDVSPARLLVEKQVLNKYLVETRDIIISYNIFNVGGSAALNVKLSDSSFNSVQFETVSGVSKFSVPRIAAESNVSHSIVIRPKEGNWGTFNFTAAEVTYQSEGSSDLLNVLSSEPGQGYIAALREFEKRFSSHLSDWFAFLVLSLSTVLFPYLLWNSSKNKYEALATKKSK